MNDSVCGTQRVQRRYMCVSVCESVSVSVCAQVRKCVRVSVSLRESERVCTSEELEVEHQRGLSADACEVTRQGLNECGKPEAPCRRLLSSPRA